MQKRTEVKRNDLIQLTDGDSGQPYTITAGDLSRNVAGNFDLVMKFMKAIEKNQKLLNIRMNEYHPVTAEEIEKINKTKKVKK